MMQNSGPLRNCCGFLRAEEAKVSAEIKAAIRLAVVQVANGPSAIAVRLTSLNEMAVVAHVLPLIGGETRLHVRPVEAAAIVVNATLDDAACSQTMATTFGLTPAETRVLSQILLGKTVAATAAEVGVAVTTARTHLDSIIMKTGVSRRSELFRLAGRIGPPNL